MTREEAIQVLKDWDGYFIGHGSDDVNEALNMAIEELKKEPCEDYISKQEVLDKITQVCFSKDQKWIDFRSSYGSNGQRDLIIKFIESLEPVTSKPKEITFDDVQRYCKSRCLTIITNELLYQFMQDTTNMDRQNAICKSHRIVGDKYECCFAEKGQPVVHCGGDKNKCEILDEED